VPCEQTHERLHGYLDGELDALGAASFEQHLAGCPDCKRTLAAEEALRLSIQQAALYEGAPQSLRNALLGKPQQQVAAVPFSLARLFAWQWVGVAAILLLVAVIGWQQWQRVRGLSEPQMMAASFVDAHLRSLQPGHLTDVESTDQHTVKPWFDGRVDFAPPVRDFANDGFPLLGGRLDVVGGRTVAALVYARRKHIVNVFVEKSSAQGEWNGSGQTQGYHWLAWQKDGFSFCAVSDVATPDLEQLRQFMLSP
jgi:mycothiol system anti-sigma-R factor